MKKNKTLIATVLFLIISIVGVAQIVTPPPPAQQVPPVGLPIDGNIIVLVVIGLLYGVYKLISKRKSSNI
ncbi:MULTISPECIES: hypothetical protein [unclassified Olleya]|jgi:uncharacterized membrane protein|uniref:hypothetical protein n=1 Tax=unclassified Olleya TaxID=2615019 RepID=UPI00119CE95F|nr:MULTISPECIES: hypothetical protein [unclassified Olleya]TVZ48192.1 hypothetical protein JM82_2827 [Olleya sp. Hel_I_94]|tara:strand:- start:20356 stop:20565 length:210 start_codon:yes stop_codon:yes gene_type:complete